MRYWVNYEEGWIGTSPDFISHGLPTEEISKEQYEELLREIKEDENE